jgi:nitrous oxidase accessory protein NosD
VLTKVASSHVEDRAGLKFERVRRCRVERVEILGAPYGIYVSESSDCRIADLLDAAERTLPVLTPNTLVDAVPLMELPR